MANGQFISFEKIALGTSAVLVTIVIGIGGWIIGQTEKHVERTEIPGIVTASPEINSHIVTKINETVRYPWDQDKGKIEGIVSHNSDAILRNSQAIQDIDKKVNQMVVNQSILGEKLDMNRKEILKAIREENGQ